MRKLKKQALFDIANGASLLASGGGGALALGHKLVNQILESTKEVSLVSVDEVGSSDWGAVIAGIGSPDQFVSIGIKNSPLEAMQKLEKELNQKFSFTLTVETGTNILIAMLPAIARGMPIVDCDGAGRAVPTLSNPTYTAAQVPISPFTIANEPDDAIAKTSISLFSEGPKNMSDLVRPIISTPQFRSIAGMATWAMNGKKLKAQGTVISGSITRAEELGAVLRISIAKGLKGDKLVQALIDHMGSNNAFVLTRAKISDIKESTTGGFDWGTMVLTDGQVTYSILNQNENLIIWSSEKDRPLAMYPDSIAYLTPDGIPFTNGDNLKELQKKHREVYIIGFKSNAALRQPSLIQSGLTDLTDVGYYGEYVPIEALQSHAQAPAKKNRALIKKIYKAFSAGDVTFILKNLSKDVKWMVNQPKLLVGGDLHTGPGEVKAYLESLGKELSITKFEVDKFIAEGQYVAVYASEEATVKSTGKTFATNVLDLWKVEDGQVTEFQGFYDSACLAGAFLA